MSIRQTCAACQFMANAETAPPQGRVLDFEAGFCIGVGLAVASLQRGKMPVLCVEHATKCVLAREMIEKQSVDVGPEQNAGAAS